MMGVVTEHKAVNAGSQRRKAKADGETGLAALP